MAHFLMSVASKEERVGRTSAWSSIAEVSSPSDEISSILIFFFQQHDREHSWLCNFGNSFCGTCQIGRFPISLSYFLICHSFSDLWRVSRKPGKFRAVKPKQNLEPYDYRAVFGRV